METERNENERRRGRRTGEEEQKKIHPEEDYIQPKPFFRKRLLMQLLTVVAVAVAVMVGVSVFFKVDTVCVTGASKYTPQTVVEASKIEAGDSLLFFGRSEAAKNIKSQLPYVGTVRFEVELPGTVNIIIEEKTVTYAIEDTEGTWWRVTSDGVVVEKIKKNASKGTTVTGVTLETPKVGELAVAAEVAGSEEPITATQAERLELAIEIFVQLELVGLFEDVTDINVSDLYTLQLSCGEDYLIELGDQKDLDTKILLIKSIFAEPDVPSSGAFELVLEDEGWVAKYYPWSN